MENTILTNVKNVLIIQENANTDDKRHNVMKMIVMEVHSANTNVGRQHVMKVIVMERFQDLGNRTLVLIRINPDKYKQGEEKIKGCFRFNRKNMIICNNNEFDTRFNLLIQKIKYYMDNQPTKELTVERLFFDT